MEVSRGANLVGMSMMPLDACPLSLLIKKKKSVQNISLKKKVYKLLLKKRHKIGAMHFF